MKRHVLLGLTLMIVCFISGGFYIASSFERSRTSLQKLAELSQIEFRRNSLEQELEVSQHTLLLMAIQEIDVAEALTHVDHLERHANYCTDCHHEPEVARRLDDMLLQLADYIELYGHVVTGKAMTESLQTQRETALEKGRVLHGLVKELSVASSDKVAERVEQVHRDMQSTNLFLVNCLVLGPIAILLITVFFLKRFTGSVDILVAAAEDLRKGDLNRHVEEPLRDEFGTLAESFNSMVDSLNTERRNFLAVNSLYQALFEAAGDGICILDGGENLFDIVSVNPSITRLYGYTAEEMVGMNCVELTPFEHQPAMCQKMEKILEGEWISCTIPRQRKDGSRFLADISAGPLVIGQEKYILTLTRDVTEKLKTQKELERAHQMATVGQMAAGLAHEIKNPLAGIKVSLEVMADELDISDDDKEVFARVLCEIDRMERLLKSLLNYARPPSPHFDSCDLNRLLESTIKNVIVTADKAKQKQISFEKTFNELPLIEADSSQLQQVFLNIYINAIDAVGKVGRISTLTRRADDGSVCVEIVNTGEGLSDSLIDKIFNPFFTTKKKGSGLGLAISRRLIEQHNGSIEVHSQVGETTTFVICLPAQQPHTMEVV